MGRIGTHVTHVVAHVGDHCCADSTAASWAVTLERMEREHGPDSDEGHSPSELPQPQPAVVLVGEAARDYQRVDALLSADVMVILLPSLQTAPSLFAPETTRPPVPSTATVGDLRVDLTGHRVLWGDRELPVSERELAILALLSEDPGRARTFAELAEPEGGKWLGDTDRVRSAIKRLRKKLSIAGADATIESVRGYGFRLVSGDPPPSLGILRRVSRALPLLRLARPLRPVMSRLVPRLLATPSPLIGGTPGSNGVVTSEPDTVLIHI
jgi:hypothetical protein